MGTITTLADICRAVERQDGVLRLMEGDLERQRARLVAVSREFKAERELVEAIVTLTLLGISVVAGFCWGVGRALM
jgi:hypothetical protein